MGNPILFFLLAAIALAAAIGMVSSRNAVHSALFLVLNFATIATFYIILNAPFIAMVQVTVYAGAIMVLFLFVIMLLGAERTQGEPVTITRWQYYLTGVLAVIVLGIFVVALVQGGSTDTASSAALDASPAAIGIRLFESYVFPFEVTSVLLLASMIGLVVLRAARRSDS